MSDKKPIEQMLAEAKAHVAAMTPAELAAMHSEQRASWVRGEMGLGSDADEQRWRAAFRAKLETKP